MIDLPYSAVSWSLRAALSACPKVALYSNVKPVSPSASRKLRHAAPPEPLCPSSTKIRLLPSNASTGTLTPPPRFSCTSLVISMTRTSSSPAVMRPLSSGSKLRHRMSEAASSARCCSLKPSFGVISRTLSSGWRW